MEDLKLPHARTPRELQDVMRQERGGTPFLVSRDADGEQVIHALGTDRDTVTIGRRATNEVVIGWDPSVSRIHAELRQVSGSWTIEDHGLSRYGTFVNGERIEGRSRLQDGDAIRVGNTLLLFRDPGTRAASAETARPSGERAPELSEAQHRVLVALCRPLAHGGFSAPASNREIADELHLGVDAVKGHLRVLFQRFGVRDLPQNRKRAALAERAFVLAAVSERDLRPRR